MEPLFLRGSFQTPLPPNYVLCGTFYAYRGKAKNPYLDQQVSAFIVTAIVVGFAISNYCDVSRKHFPSALLKSEKMR